MKNKIICLLFISVAFFEGYPGLSAEDAYKPAIPVPSHMEKGFISIKVDVPVVFIARQIGGSLVDLMGPRHLTFNQFDARNRSDELKMLFIGTKRTAIRPVRVSPVNRNNPVAARKGIEALFQ